jgi:RNA polymerase sigma-70 factor (ECF subfamily)
MRQHPVVLPAVRSGFVADVDLEAMVALLTPRLLAYAYARTGCRRTAEDVAQDALTALVRRWRTSGPPDSPDAYAFAIARRRAGRAVVRRALLAPLDVLHDAVDGAPDVEQTYAGRAELIVVRAALRRLPRLDREALVLRAAGELPLEAIARVMRSSPAAVKMRIMRARRRLAALLAEPVHGR